MPGGSDWPQVTLADGTRDINLPGPVLTLQLNEAWLGGQGLLAQAQVGAWLEGQMGTCGSADGVTMKSGIRRNRLSPSVTSNPLLAWHLPPASHLPPNCPTPPRRDPTNRATLIPSPHSISLPNPLPPSKGAVLWHRWHLGSIQPPHA